MIAAAQCNICNRNFSTSSWALVRVCPHIEMRCIEPVIENSKIELKEEFSGVEYTDDYFE